VSRNYPASYYFIALIGLFLYQTLDALDGKHARAIGLASPIGQLLDHGLDSFSASIFVITTVVSLNIPNDSHMIWCLNLVNTVIMFLANAEEFYTGMMRTNINGVGVTEIQFM
jgi:ethanolaminephosphotransferase